MLRIASEVVSVVCTQAKWSVTGDVRLIRTERSVSSSGARYFAVITLTFLFVFGAFLVTRFEIAVILLNV